MNGMDNSDNGSNGYHQNQDCESIFFGGSCGHVMWFENLIAVDREYLEHMYLNFLGVEIDINIAFRV